ncbi:MAG: metal-dependent phosphohydrolase, partial [Gaiellales bacterium]
YPERLKGEEIPVLARIVGIIDSYRAMVSDRPYRQALTQAEAIAELRKGAGTQFDPEMVELFIEAIDASPGQEDPLLRAV